MTKQCSYWVEYPIHWSDGCRQEQDHSVSPVSIQAYGLSFCDNYTQKHPESESQHAPSKPPSRPSEPGPLTPSNPHWQLGKASNVWCCAMLAPCEKEWQYQTLLYCTYAQTNLSATQTNPPVHYTNQTLFAIFSVLFKIMPLTWFHYHFQDHIHSVVHRYNRSRKSINMIRRVNIVWNCHGKHNLKETSYCTST